MLFHDTHRPQDNMDDNLKLAATLLGAFAAGMAVVYFALSL